MPSHSESRFLPYTPEELFSLVSDIESYPRFLPWCAAARIVRREGNGLLADLVIRFKTFQERYRSHVTLTPPAEGTEGSIDVRMVEGPFTHLENHWRFSPAPGGTQITFSIDFRFKSSLLEKLMGLMFDKALKTMADAFGKQAEALYGKR